MSVTVIALKRLKIKLSTCKERSLAGDEQFAETNSNLTVWTVNHKQLREHKNLHKKIIIQLLWIFRIISDSISSISRLNLLPCSEAQRQIPLLASFADASLISFIDKRWHLVVMSRRYKFELFWRTNRIQTHSQINLFR